MRKRLGGQIHTLFPGYLRYGGLSFSPLRELLLARYPFCSGLAYTLSVLNNFFPCAHESLSSSVILLSPFASIKQTVWAQFINFSRQICFYSYTHILWPIPVVLSLRTSACKRKVYLFVFQDQLNHTSPTEDFLTAPHLQLTSDCLPCLKALSPPPCLSDGSDVFWLFLCEMFSGFSSVRP